jgi:hypothetical protein
MSEDLFSPLIDEFFRGGWRISPFIRTPDGYIGVQAWPKRAARNFQELSLLIDEIRQKTNRAIIYGVVPDKGRYVVDIDTKKNTRALELWKDRVHEAMGDIGLGYPSLVVKTKSGGYHLYYSDGSDREIRSPTGIFGKDSGIDIRGYTGMVVAPTALGTEEDWNPGEYMIVRGAPDTSPTVLAIHKIIGDFVSQEDVMLSALLKQVNEALRNPSVNENARHKLLPDSLIINVAGRDNTLYRCARLCRHAGLSQDAALIFMSHLATRCEATPEEPTEHWVHTACDKVRRVYADEREMSMRSVSMFFDELDHAGLVMLNGVSKSYYFFRHGSPLLRIERHGKFSTDNFPNVLQGVTIQSEDDPIPAKKVLGMYTPKETAFETAMFPKAGEEFFEYQGRRYVNIYEDPFQSFEPDPGILERAEPLVQRFLEFARHITGYEDGDDKRLLDKLLGSCRSHTAACLRARSSTLTPRAPVKTR